MQVSGDFEETVGWSGTVGCVQRGVAASDQDCCRGFVEDNEVVGDFCTGVVRAGEQFLLGPQLVAGASGVFVFGAEILPLDRVACDLI